MDIIIQSLGFTAGEELETFTREKLNKFDNEAKIIRADVMLFIGPASKHDKYCCEVRLEIPGNDLFVKKCSDSFEKAIVNAADALHKSMRRTKDKMIERHHGGLTGEA
jgi:putative sigma-54 modulation protein